MVFVLRIAYSRPHGRPHWDAMFSRWKWKIGTSKRCREVVHLLNCARILSENVVKTGSAIGFTMWFYSILYTMGVVMIECDVDRDEELWNVRCGGGIGLSNDGDFWQVGSWCKWVVVIMNCAQWVVMILVWGDCIFRNMVGSHPDGFWSFWIDIKIIHWHATGLYWYSYPY